MLAVPRQEIRGDDPQSGQQRDEQRELEGEAEREEKLHVEVHVKAHAELGYQRPVNAELQHKLERQWDDHEIGKGRSEEHTSELQSPCNLVCRLLLEKKKYTQ